MHFISAQDTKENFDQKKISLIDIREPYERDICLIKGSTHIPMCEVEKLKQVVKNTKNGTVFICKSGKRAEATANLIEKELKIDTIHILEGGMIAWIEKIDQTLENY